MRVRFDISLLIPFFFDSWYQKGMRRIVSNPGQLGQSLKFQYLPVTISEKMKRKLFKVITLTKSTLLSLLICEGNQLFQKLGLYCPIVIVSSYVKSKFDVCLMPAINFIFISR